MEGSGKRRPWWAVLGFFGAAILILGAFYGFWLSRSVTSIESLAAQSQDSDGELSVSAEVISSDDLPPEGTRSLFDHLLARNDGLVYPFDDLVQMLEQSAPPDAEQASSSVLIPLGRSLLKGSADFAVPRIVVALDYHAENLAGGLGILPRGQLFLGFTENADEIEVISYNEFAGRFEFQLVQDYCEGCNPRIVYARRAICLTCHQGGTPIFPQRPWQETNGQPQIAARILDARAQDHYLGEPVNQPLSAPERVDELTDVANFVSVAQGVWLDGCGLDGTACRRRLLSLSLSYLDSAATFDPKSEDYLSLFDLQARNWPEQGIPVPNNDLNNRDPLAPASDLPTRITNWILGRDPSARPAANNEDLEAFDKLPALPQAFDPLTARGVKKWIAADEADGVFAIAQLFSNSDRQLIRDELRRLGLNVQSAVLALDEEIFAAKPVSRVRILRALLGHTASEQSGMASRLQYCCQDTSEMSAPIVAGIPRIEISENSALLPYEKYCFACHRGNPAQRLDFMSGDTESEVLKKVSETVAIRDALDWERFTGTPKESLLMPPLDSEQRNLLERDLASDPRILNEMREVVPGLFDF